MVEPWAPRAAQPGQGGARANDEGAQTRPREGRDLLTEAEWHAVRRALDLSERELQIAFFIFDDHKESSIASALGISPHTVHTHLERLYRKLSVKSRSGLILRIMGEHKHRALTAPGNSADPCPAVPPPELLTGGLGRAPAEFRRVRSSPPRMPQGL